MKLPFVQIKGIFILFVFFFVFVPELRAQSGNIHYEKMLRALQIVRSLYIEPVTDAALVENAIRGMLRELDPHSVYLTAEELRQANEPLLGSFDGIGVQFNVINDSIVVVSAVPDGPSERVGILPGDKIVTIDGKSSVGSHVNNQFVLDRLRGRRGTQVTVGIARRGSNEVLQFNITRDRIPINSVDAAFMAAPRIGYIKISRFAVTTIQEFLEALSQLEKQGMEHLILDLNFNSGGLLDVAINLTDQFLDANKLIVYTEGNASPTQRRYSTNQGAFLKGKLVVLINEGSASASEILAGAIQDWDRGFIVGRRSFGKGLVQQSFNLPGGSAIRLTTARYHTPTGRSIQKPYEEGSDAYFDELTQRLRLGELVSSKNVTFPDSLKYYTKINKREVFGGGGIMPDFFIPIDTTLVSEFYAQLVRSGVLNNFGIEFTNQNRELLLQQYPDLFSFMEKFNVDEALVNQMLAYAVKNGINPGNEAIATPEDLFYLQLKGLVARNLFGFDAYIQVLAQEDDSINKAIELIQGNLFREMNIRYR
ncbi:MAG TPA: S41 family peptidase [Bacteroidales bacterium]|nr:S41 family peptidase [Bacteroidales bacterium]